MTGLSSGDAASTPATSPGALRTRRYRAHRDGDHSLCLPANCPRAGQSPAAMDDAAATVPEPVEHDWGPSGAQLWRDLRATTPPAYLPVLREACRIADRLDRIDRILDGRRDWLRISTLDFGENVKVKITLDGVLAEARQQGTAVLAMLKELQAVQPKVPAQPTTTGGLGDLAARIAARRGAAAG